MNILILTPLFPPGIGGAATYFKLLVDHLSNKQSVKKILVFTEYVRNAPLFQNINYNTNIWRCLPPRDHVAIKGFFYRFVMYCLTHILLFLTIPFVILKYNIDIIHSHSRLTRRYLYIVARIFHIKTIIDLRDKMFNPTNIKKFDVIICASKAIYAEAIRQNLPEVKMNLVPIPFKPFRKLNMQEGFLEKYSITKPYLCFLGNVIQMKGIYELIDAFEGFILKNKNYSLIIAGYNHEGRKLIRRIKNKPNIKYVGPLNSKDVAVFIKNSELLVLPSKSEGMPRVCLEAISLKKKVIIPPNIPELNKECPKFVLNEVTSKDLQRKIEEIIDYKEIPSYPLHRHNPAVVFDQVYNIYRKCFIKK